MKNGDISNWKGEKTPNPTAIYPGIHKREKLPRAFLYFNFKNKKESLRSNSFLFVAHRGIPSFPQGILRSSNAYASGLLPQSPSGLPACFQHKIKKESLHSNSFSIVAHRGIEPLFPEWKSGVLTDRRMGLIKANLPPPSGESGGKYRMFSQKSKQDS